MVIFYKLILKVGAEEIRRAAAPNDHPIFINALADIVTSHLQNNVPLNPKFLMRCPHCVNSRCLESKKWFKTLCN